MPVDKDPKDTQPLRGKPVDNHRMYIPAEWAAAGGGTGHPKLSGGVTVDKKTGELAPRAFNRPDQRYDLPLTEINNRRIARAAEEYPDTIILVGAINRFEVRTKTGNCYDVSPDVLHCDCPDYLRLVESGYGQTLCKHIRMVNLAKADSSLPQGIPYSCAKVAEMVGAEERTIQNLCQIGEIEAVQRHRVWVIQPDDADLFAQVYISNIWPYS